MLLNSVDRLRADAGRWTFVTLTYHLRQVTARETKDHLSDLKKRLYRRFGPDVCGIWKLEPQKRGKPHFHLLLHSEPNVDRAALREFFVKHWHAIAEPDSEEHLRCLRFVGRTAAGHKKDWFQAMISWNQVAGYAAKYCGKLVKQDPNWVVPGRFWGYVNKRSFKRFISIRRERVSEAAAIWVGRQLRRYLAHQLNGRVDTIIPGRGRVTLSRAMLKVPGLKFKEGQKLYAESNGGCLKSYRYKPKGTRNRSSFAPAEMVQRLVAYAKGQSPISSDELLEDASRDVRRFMSQYLDDRSAVARLHRSMPRVANAIYYGKRGVPEAVSSAVVPRSEPLLLFSDLEVRRVVTRKNVSPWHSG